MDVKTTLRDVQAHLAWLKDEKERMSLKEKLTGDDLVLLDDLPSLSRQTQRPRLDDRLFTEQQTELATELEQGAGAFPENGCRASPVERERLFTNGRTSMSDSSDRRVAQTNSSVFVMYICSTT